MKIGKQIHQVLHQTLWIAPVIDWVVFGLVLIFSWWLMSSTFGYKDGQFVIDSKLYSDFAAHLPLIRSFSHGNNFPPEYPYFVGQPIRYHYLFYLAVGMLERVGIRIDFALNSLSAVGMALMLFMIYKTAVLFFSKRAVGMLAIFLVLFNGSLSFVEYFSTYSWTVEAARKIVDQVQFASFGPWSGRLVSAFWNWNIYTNQRHLALGYGLILLILFPLLSIVIKKKQYSVPSSRHRMWLSIGIVSVFVLLPLLHQASYLMLVGFVILWVLCYPKRTRPLWLPYGLAIVLSLGVFLLLTTGKGQEWEVLFGYLSPDKSLAGVLTYWWNNLGLYFVLLPLLLIWSIQKKNYFLPILFTFFLLANVMRLSTDMINNHKFINFFMIGVSIMTAGLIGQVWQRSNMSRVFLVVLIVALTFSGIVDLFPIVNDYSGMVQDEPKSPMQQYIRYTTSPRSQFVTNTYMYNPASLAGRMLFLDYGYYAWSMGYDDHSKRQLLPKIFANQITIDQWCQVVLAAGIEYILLDPQNSPLEDGRISVNDSMIGTEISPTYASADGWRLYDVAHICLPL